VQLGKAFQRSTRSNDSSLTGRFSKASLVGRFLVLALLVVACVGGASADESYTFPGTTGVYDSSYGTGAGHKVRPSTKIYLQKLNLLDRVEGSSATFEVIDLSTGSTIASASAGQEYAEFTNPVELESGQSYKIVNYDSTGHYESTSEDHPYNGKDLTVDGYYNTCGDGSCSGPYDGSYAYQYYQIVYSYTVNEEPVFNSTSTSPDPPLIGENVSYSLGASDSDGNITSGQLTVFKDGQQVYQDSQSFSSSSVSYTWSDVYVPSSSGDLDAKYTITDDAGASTTSWLNRSLTDGAASVDILSPGNQTFWSYDRTLQVDTGGGDSVPDEELTCTSDLDGQSFDSRTVTEGETFSTGFDAGLGSHTVSVSCTDPQGHTNTTSVDFTTKAFKLQSVSSSSSVYESANTSYTADFRIGSMVENVSTELNWDNEVRNSEMYSNGGVVENVSLRHYFRPPVVQTDGVSKDWFFDYTVDYLDVDGNSQSVNTSSAVQSQTVDYAFYGPQISLNKDRIVESGDFEATNSWTEELGVSPAERVSTISFNGSSFTAETEMLEAPIVSQNSTTKTVSGDLTVSFKNQSRTMQSTTDSIDVYKKILTKCGAGLNSAEALKFSLYNEENRSSTMTGNIVYNFDTTLDGDHVRNYAFDMSGVKNVSTCIYPSWAEYKVTGPIQYSSESSQNVYDQAFPDRQYNLYNQTLNSNLRNVDLYLLSDQYATPVYFEVLNQAGEGVSGATVSVNRYFIGEDSYLTVAKSQTDSEGVATTYMRVNEIYYKYTVTKDGEVLLDTDREILTCQSSPCTKTLRINEQEDNPYFVERQGFSYNVTNLTDDEGNITGVQATVSHDSDVFKDASLKVERRGSVSTETVCDITSSSNPSTMVCELDEPAGDDYITYVLKASTDGNTYTLDTGVISEPSNIFGDTAYFAAFALFLMFSMIGMASPKIGIIFSTAGILVPWMLGFYALSLAAVGSLVAVALALVVTNNS